MTWLGEVRDLTEDFRNGRALHHVAEAWDAHRFVAHFTRATASPPWSRLSPESRAELAAEVSRAETRARWHEGRAVGQRMRFERVGECRKRSGEARCGGCGIVHQFNVRCGVWRLCLMCRRSAALARRARFGAGRAAAILRGRQAGLLRRLRRGGRWSEKFLTLTAPHVGSVEDRLAVFKRAWRRFSKKLQAYWRSRARRFSPEKRLFYRFTEWTPGADLQGHPHFHVWLWCDWLDVEDLRGWWSEALRAEGVNVDEDRITNGVSRSMLLVDLREVRTRPEEMARELAKADGPLRLSKLTIGGGMAVAEYADGWTLTEYEDGERISPETAAALYRAFEGTRVAQASKGFLPARPTGCRACGAPSVAVYLGHADEVSDIGEFLKLWRTPTEHPPRPPP